MAVQVAAMVRPSLAWSPSPPSASVTRKAAGEKSCFLQGIRPAVTLAQVFGLLPVTKPSDDDAATFNWRSLRVAFSLSIIAGTLAESILSLKRMMETGVSFYTSVNVIFYSSSMVASLMFLRLGAKWKELISYWSLLERYLTRLLGDPLHLSGRMVAATTIVLGLAFVEHMLSIASTLSYVWPCYKRGGIALLIQGYFLTKYQKIFTLITYSVWKAAIVLALQFITVFVWNFLDLFIILISMGLCASFRLFNQSLFSIKGKMQSEEFWRQRREAYNALALLTKTVDAHVGPVVVLSFASNLYFICLQLLVITKNPDHLSHYDDAYFYFSLIYLIIRTCLMSFLAANVFDESQKPKQVLFCVPSSGYCREVQRFLTQVNTDAIALTGCNFFSITRSFMLTVAGTIVTYVVILVQFEDSAADPEKASTNNTVSCTCEDIKVYTC